MWNEYAAVTLLACIEHSDAFFSDLLYCPLSIVVWLCVFKPVLHSVCYTQLFDGFGVYGFDCFLIKIHLPVLALSIGGNNITTASLFSM